MFISCIQTNPQDNLKGNLLQTFELVKKAAKDGAEVVVLPEMFTYMGNESNRKSTKDVLGKGVFLDLQNLARDLKINLIGGSHAETVKDNDDKCYNTSCSFDKNGSLISTYRKLHLFNLKDASGNKIYCESDSFEEGTPPEPFLLKCQDGDWNALNIICYDIRFPEILRRLNKPIDILFVPAAFTWQTGKDHWEVLLRARAIENLCYVVACNQTGFHTEGQKRNYGNSMIIDPWGNVVSRLGEECGILSCQLDKNKIAESRQRLSALSDRKLF